MNIDVRFNIAAIRRNPELNMLTWEIIEARGCGVGDLVKLWETAIALGESAAVCEMQMKEAAEIIATTDDREMYEGAQELYAMRHMLRNYFIRDAREIVKFLDNRGFGFPEGKVSYE